MLDSGEVTDAKDRKAFELKKGTPSVVMFVGLQVRAEGQGADALATTVAVLTCHCCVLAAALHARSCWKGLKK